MKIQTDRLIVSAVRARDATDLRGFSIANRRHLARWEPSRDRDWNAANHWVLRAAQYEAENQTQSALRLVARHPHSMEIIAVASFTNIVKGPFEACHLGFSVSRSKEGHGLMHEMLTASISHVFENMNLHRIMANYMPRNLRSERLLERLGFEREGYAKSYLKIAGKWEDHILTSLIHDEPRISETNPDTKNAGGEYERSHN